MKLESPHLIDPVGATYESIAELIPRLVDAEDPFAIVSTTDPMMYAQVIWTPRGFSLDYQAGRSDQHFRSLRDDLTVEETIAALNSYAGGAPIWSLGLEFTQLELRSVSGRVEYAIGQAVGHIRRFFR